MQKDLVLAKMFSGRWGYAAVNPLTGNFSGFDPEDSEWVNARAEEHDFFVRVAPDVTAAWSAGKWDRPIEVHMEDGIVCFAGQGMAAAILAGRREALENVI